MFFTSGTTGYPKMTQVSCASYGLGHKITATYWMDLCPTDIHWNLSDTGWAKSAYSNVFSPWINGSCVFIHSMPRIDPPLILQVSSDFMLFDPLIISVIISPIVIYILSLLFTVLYGLYGSIPQNSQSSGNQPEDND